VVAQRVIGGDSLFGLEANLVYWLWGSHLGVICWLLNMGTYYEDFVMQLECVS
jgi:hypothetical protein